MKTFSVAIGYQERRAHYVERREDNTAFLQWAARHPHIALDTETTGLQPWSNPDFRVRLVQISDGDTAWLLTPEVSADAIRRVLAHTQRMALFNAPFDIGGLAVSGLIDWDHGWDIHVDGRTLAHLLDSRNRHLGGCPLNLKSLAHHVVEKWSLKAVRYRKDTERADLVKAASESLGRKVSKDDMWKVIPTDNPTYLRYSAKDVLWTWHLTVELARRVREHGFSQLHERERRFARIVADMERRGMAVDVEYTQQLERDMTADVAAMDAEMEAEHGIKNPRSPQQVLEAFHRYGEHPVDDKGKPTTSKHVLATMTDRSVLAVDMLNHRQEQKALSGTVRPLLELRTADDKVHPGYKPLGTVTARMSCSKPNLQQMPKRRGTAEKLRSCLLADEGHIIVASDLSQIEYRVAASLSRDRNMLQAYIDGEDLHTRAARLIFGLSESGEPTSDQRTLAKNAGFGKLYGAGSATIARQTGATIERAKQLVAQYDEAFSGLASWSRSVVDEVEQQLAAHGEAAVSTPYGRRVPADPERPYAAVNYIVQSAARDVLVDWVFAADDVGLTEGLLGIIHDELVMQMRPEDASDAARTLERLAGDLYLPGVPIVAEAESGDRTWGSLYRQELPPQDDERPDTEEGTE